MRDHDDEFDRLLHSHRPLSQDEHDQLVRHAVARANAYRAEAIHAVFWWLLAWFRHVFGWFRRRAAVAQLRALDDRMLKDIGISRGEIESVIREAERSPRELPRDLSSKPASVTAFPPSRPAAPRRSRRSPSSPGRVGRAA